MYKMIVGKHKEDGLWFCNLVKPSKLHELDVVEGFVTATNYSDLMALAAGEGFIDLINNNDKN